MTLWYAANRKLSRVVSRDAGVVRNLQEQNELVSAEIEMRIWSWTRCYALAKRHYGSRSLPEKPWSVCSSPFVLREHSAFLSLSLSLWVIMFYVKENGSLPHMKRQRAKKRRSEKWLFLRYHLSKLRVYIVPYSVSVRPVVRNSRKCCCITEDARNIHAKPYLP